MPARTGRQYLEGLRSQEREVWLGGERVRDVTRHPGLASGAKAIASLYDMQCAPELREIMTYKSPTTNDAVGLSFIIPRHARRPGPSPGDDAALGPCDLRHDGPIAGFHERHVRGVGRFG